MSVKADTFLSGAKSRWWAAAVIATVLIVLEIVAWFFPENTRSIAYKILLIAGYVAVLGGLIFARRLKFAAPAALGIVSGMPVAAIYLVAAVLQ